MISKKAIYLRLFLVGWPILLWADKAPIPANGRWGDAVKLDTDDIGIPEYPRLAVDGQNCATVIWRETSKTTQRIRSIRLLKSGKKLSDVLASVERSKRILDDLDVAADAQGHVFAVWESVTQKPVHGAVMVRRYDPIHQWGPATTISFPNAYSSNRPRVGIDGQGVATVAWIHVDQSHSTFSLAYNFYNPGQGWGKPQRFKSIKHLIPWEAPRLSVGRGGVKAIVWDLGGGTTSYVISAIDKRGRTWNISPFPDSHAGEPDVAVNSSGTAIAVWLSPRESPKSGIWVSQYTPSTGWNHPVLISTPTGNADNPRVAINAQGDALVAWTQPGATSWHQLQSSRLVTGKWVKPELLSTGEPELGPASATAPVLDDRGDGFILWSRERRSLGDGPIYAQSLIAGHWLEAESISAQQGSITSAINSRLALTRDHGPIAVWIESGQDGVAHVYARQWISF